MDKKLQAKNIKPLYDELMAMPSYTSSVEFGDAVMINTGKHFGVDSEVYALAKKLMPWRKGPFRIDDIEIESEWNSFVKFNLLEPYMDLKGKTVVDIGCNNAYYAFRMLPKEPKKIIAIDPWPIFYLQYLFVNKFVNSDIIDFRMVGLEDMADEGIKADVMFCLGILYHRTDPISSLKALKSSLNNNGELFIDNMVIMKDGYYALCPPESYAKMSNAYFIPTIDTMRGWLERAGFCDVELLCTKPTDVSEQRKTDWIDGQSLNDFLDKNDPSKTVEGFDAPVRAYFRCRRIDGKR